MKQFLTIVGVYFVLAIGVIYIAHQQGNPERDMASRAAEAGKVNLAN